MHVRTARAGKAARDDVRELRDAARGGAKLLGNVLVEVRAQQRECEADGPHSCVAQTPLHRHAHEAVRDGLAELAVAWLTIDVIPSELEQR